MSPCREFCHTVSFVKCIEVVSLYRKCSYLGDGTYGVPTFFSNRRLDYTFRTIYKVGSIEAISLILSSGAEQLTTRSEMFM